MWIKNVSRNYKVDLDKWRFLRTMKYENKKTFLYVVVFPLRWFGFKETTVDEFLSEWNENRHADVSGVDNIDPSFLRVAARCPSCLGWGKLNWIDVARDRSPNRSPDLDDCNSFEIDKPVYHYSQSGSRKASFVTSKPKLHETDKLCKECFGSGISLNHPNGNNWYWNTLGDWYKKMERI